MLKVSRFAMRSGFIFSFIISPCYAIIRSMLSTGAKNIIVAGLFFSVINALVKFYSHIPAIEIVFFRSFVSLIMSFIAIKKAKVHIFDGPTPLLLMRGLSGAIGLSLYFYCIQNMPLATAVTVFYLAPIFTVIMGVFINKERPH